MMIHAAIAVSLVFATAVPAWAVCSTPVFQGFGVSSKVKFNDLQELRTSFN